MALIWQLWIKDSTVSDYHNDYDDDYEDNKPLPPIITVRPSKKNRR
ncbi:hypothetical protein CRENPOLYSF1_890035 [Crenothrix polyspora]|uniref:Uncharacterized protein n=1 Tax=Crenothrix polyspora TaxID=360316 RepID=A0A1R4HJG3_9GAMM|nr:hypothetical protein CRENPOLYSF1_890035 [Crenothrix polyspora]